MSLARPHPLIRLALFGALYLCGYTGLQGVALGLYLAFDPDPAAVAGLEAGRLPAELLIPGAWLALLAAVGLAALFHAWGGEDPLYGLRAGWRALGRDSLAGLALGLAAMLGVAAAYSMLGWVAWELEPDVETILSALILSGAALLPAAAAEEVVFRGYVLRTLEAWRGWPLALVASSALFGLAHAANPNVTGLALANIALAGAAFALTYRLAKGQLWLPIAYHFLWNYAQGPLLGFPVSGLGFAAAARARVEGPPVWTGGAFGPEGGLVVTAILLATCGGLWWWGRRGITRERGNRIA